MTKEEVIKVAKMCIEEGCKSSCPFSGNDGCVDALIKEILHYLKENEPAPSGNDTSSTNKNNSQLNDTAKLKDCQEKIADIKENLLLIYEGMTNEEQRAWELGEIFNQITNLLKSGDNNV